MATCGVCGKETFRYSVVDGTNVCGRCPHPSALRNIPGAMFPYPTTQFNGERVVIQSLRHMRQLEREHGVQSVAFNQDARNWNDAPQTNFKEITRWKYEHERR